jgi:DNA helicase-2/ATP-dependent DNA helicase PcrA
LTKSNDTWSSTERSKRRPLPRPRTLDTGYLEETSTSGKGEPRFHSGQRVKHAKFGEGMVIESKLTGNDEEVTVAFSEGVKRLAASFANLEILE